MDGPSKIHGWSTDRRRARPTDGARPYTATVGDACEQNPFGLLVGLAERLRAFLDAAAADEGLTAQQAQVLLQVDGPLQMSELAGRKLCDPSSVTAMVKRLERSGHVQRVVDPTDRRARLVRLTARGRRSRARLQARLAGADRVIAELDDDQRAALAGLFADSRRSV